MEIRPFRGWHYPAGDVSALLAPPYDVLSAADKDALLAADGRNIVAVDLPHVPPHEEGPAAVYAQAAARLAEWQKSGALVQDYAPAVYVYEQEFAWGGREFLRRAVIAGVRCGGDDIKKHERTYAGPKADRLALTRATGTQLSPIFGFYRDPSGAVAGLLAAAAAKAPDLTGQLRGVAERVWIVTEPKTIAALSAALSDLPLFIADGHHRYTTAVNYRDQEIAAERADCFGEVNFVMFVMVEAADPGLFILPTHRMIRGLKAGLTPEDLVKASPQFAWKQRPLEASALNDLDLLLARQGAGSMAFVFGDRPELWTARLTDESAMAAAAAQESEAWRRLDVSVLHKLLVDGAMAAWRTPQFGIDYTPDPWTAVEACRTGRCQVAVLLRGTPLAAVEEIALAGQVMPHKSTYFFPKPATGLVLKPL